MSEKHCWKLMPINGYDILYRDGWTGSIGWIHFKYFSVETMSSRCVLPLLLSVLGFLLLDISYLTGLFCLHRYLVLRLDHTVLRADYQGEQDLSRFLERFAQMMASV